jgi:acetolactate synthase-1/2/3 large subunit
LIIRSTGADAVVSALTRRSIRAIHGLPGVHLDPLFDALHRASGDIRAIHTRHEQGAAYMALGAAMATGQPAVFTVVPGPGLLNAGAALATAYACNAPVLCITSTVAWPLLDKHYGSLHELPDQAGILSRLTKWSARAEHASQVPQLMNEAFRQLTSGRPRPVAIEIPPEVLAQSGVFSEDSRTGGRDTRERGDESPSASSTVVDAELIEAAARLAASALRPVIVVGGGALDAAAEVRELAELLHAPVISRQMGRGVLSDEHPLSVQAAAANRIWSKADLVIGIGTRLQQLREWGRDSDLRVIRIDVDPQEHTRIAPPDVSLVAEAAAATRALSNALRTRAVQAHDQSVEMNSAKETVQKEMRAQIPLQVAFLDAIRAELPRDGLVVDEITQVGHAAKLAFPVYGPRTLFSSGYQGTLGYGYATALGVQAALPERRVISINGDGGFMYTMPELATAVHHKLPVVALIFNDESFGNVETIQRRWYGGRTIATRLTNPDFVGLAHDFGALGLRARDPQELRAALRTAFAERRPTLIDIPVKTEAMGWVWSFILPNHVRGAA